MKNTLNIIDEIICQDVEMKKYIPNYFLVFVVSDEKKKKKIFSQYMMG